MQKYIFFGLFLLAGSSFGDFTCDKDGPEPFCADKDCLTAIHKQVYQELGASSFYLHMAGLLDNWRVNKPGLAKFLYEGAAEERQHAIMMLEYLNTRGYDYSSITNAEATIPVDSSISTYTNYISMLQAVRNKEVEVTNLIHNMITTCKDDFHGADVLTNPIMEEQHEAVRKLQGVIREYNHLANQNSKTEHRNYAEFVVDQKLFSGEI